MSDIDSTDFRTRVFSDENIKPLPAHVSQYFTSDNAESLRKSKPPFVLLPLTQKPKTRLPFIQLKGAVHPYSSESERGQLTKMHGFESFVMIDTGNETTRLCADLFGVDLQPGETECCMISIEYFLYDIITILMSRLDSLE